MQLVTFTDSTSKDSASTRVGLLNDAGIIDLAQVDPGLPTDMLTLIEAGPEALEQVKAAADAKTADAANLALADVKLEPIMKRPPKIIAIGLNYRKHAEESGMELPKVPLVFTKQSTSVTGPYDPIFWSEDSKLLDYEGELAIIIGKNCRRVPRDKAKNVIFGLTVVNDVSVRDWQTRGTPPSFTMGKSWDSHCPIGPGIVVDPQLDPHNLELKTWVNDELRQETNTNDLIFDCYELIEFLSTAFMLEAGDVIVTGTPSGVGAAMQPRQFLKPGDRVKVEIESVGAIENEVIVEPQERAQFF